MAGAPVDAGSGGPSELLRQTVLVLGDSTVGKTALIKCLCTGGVERGAQYEMTTAPQLHTKVFKSVLENVDVEQYLIDTPGQAVFTTGGFGQSTWSTASCVMVVYDVTVTDSFTSSAKWLRQLLDAREGKPLPGVLVANKVDLESDDRRVVSEEEGKETAAGFHLEYFETSALQASGVDAPFEALASGLASRWQAAKGALEAGDV